MLICVDLQDRSYGLLPSSIFKVPRSILLSTDELIPDEFFYYVTDWHALDERLLPNQSAFARRTISVDGTYIPW